MEHVYLCKVYNEIHSACSDGGIRLIGGTRPHEGRVEVCLNSRWGTVCDDAWGTLDASVACRQLGYSAHSMLPQLYSESVCRYRSKLCFVCTISC